MSLTSLTDEELLRRFRGGESRAFEVLYHRYRLPLYAFLNRFVSDRQTADELHQEVFLKVVRAAADFEERSKFSTWLYRIARNLCVDRLRRMSYRKTASLDQSVGSGKDGEEGRRLGDMVPDPNGDVERQVGYAEARRAVARAVAALPDEQREVFLLREVSGLSFKEIAEVVGCPENTAKSRMRYALERLREALAEFGDLARDAGRESAWGKH